MKIPLALFLLLIAFALPAAEQVIAGRGIEINPNGTPELAARNPDNTGAKPVAEPPAPAPSLAQGKFFTDQFLSLRTTDFSHDETFSYGAAVGYQFTPVFAADVRVEHEGLNITGQAIRTVGGRVSARLPIQFLSPSVFAGAAFDLGANEWRLQPGIAAEIGMSKLLRGMSLIVEGGLDSNPRGQSGFLLTSGLRWRF